MRRGDLDSRVRRRGRRHEEPSTPDEPVGAYHIGSQGPASEPESTVGRSRARCDDALPQTETTPPQSQQPGSRCEPPREHEVDRTETPPVRPPGICRRGDRVRPLLVPPAPHRKVGEDRQARPLPKVHVCAHDRHRGVRRMVSALGGAHVVGGRLHRRPGGHDILAPHRAHRCVGQRTMAWIVGRYPQLLLASLPAGSHPKPEDATARTRGATRRIARGDRQPPGVGRGASPTANTWRVTLRSFCGTAPTTANRIRPKRSGIHAGRQTPRPCGPLEGSELPCAGHRHRTRR